MQKLGIKTLKLQACKRLITSEPKVCLIISISGQEASVGQIQYRPMKVRMAMVQTTRLNVNVNMMHVVVWQRS